MADAYLFTVLNWTRPYQIDLAPYPSCRPTTGRIATYDRHVQTAMAAEADRSELRVRQAVVSDLARS